MNFLEDIIPLPPLDLKNLPPVFYIFCEFLGRHNTAAVYNNTKYNRVRVIIYLRDYLRLIPAEIRALPLIPPAAAVIDLQDKNITFQREFKEFTAGIPVRVRLGLGLGFVLINVMLQREFTAAISGNPGGGGNEFRG